MLKFQYWDHTSHRDQCALSNPESKVDKERDFYELVDSDRGQAGTLTQLVLLLTWPGPSSE